MSNQVCITRTTFVDNADSEKTYGYRMFDDYASTYNNFYDADFLELSALEVIKQVSSEGGQTEKEMFSFINEHERGITVDKDYLEYTEFKHLISDSEAQ